MDIFFNVKVINVDKYIFFLYRLIEDFIVFRVKII